MNCNTCQSHLCERLDTAPNATLNVETGEHLTTCPACQRFQESLLALDEQLIRKSCQATLPADFASTVLARLPQSKPRLSPAEIAERKARCEREHQAAMTSFNWTLPFLKAAAWLQIGSFTGVCAGLGWLLADMFKQLPLGEHLIQLQSYTVSAAQLLAYGAGVMALAFGVMVVKRPALLRAKW